VTDSLYHPWNARFGMAQARGYRVPILMYHSVSEKAVRRFRPYALSPALFAAQMDYLRQRGYATLTISDLVRSRSGLAESPRAPAVVLTFDDGYADFYTEALPVLRRYGFVATLFVTSGDVGGTSTWLEREGEGQRPMVAWWQLREILSAGVEVGGHTSTHRALDWLSPAEAREEIMRCKEELEAQLGRSISSFAYPYGYYTHAVRDMVQAAGYTSACAVRHRLSPPHDDTFAMARLLVAGGTGAPRFARVLTGRDLVATVLRPAHDVAWGRYRSVAFLATKLLGRTGP